MMMIPPTTPQSPMIRFPQTGPEENLASRFLNQVAAPQMSPTRIAPRASNGIPKRTNLSRGVLWPASLLITHVLG